MHYFDPDNLNSYAVVETDNVCLETLESQVRHTSFETTTRYDNRLNTDITIATRNSPPVKIPASQQYLPGSFIDAEDAFIVIVTYRVSANVKVDPQGQLKHESRCESELLRQAYSQSRYAYNDGSRFFQVIYRIKREDFTRNGGYIYVPQIDLVLKAHTGADNTAPTVTHPYSDAHNRQEMLKSMPDVNEKDRFGLKMFIISNDGQCPDKYINILGSVYRIPSRKDERMPDGFYVTSDGTAQPNTAYPMPVSRRMSIEEGTEVYRLYDSIKEAENEGDELANRERELYKLRMESKEQEERIRRERTEYEQHLTQLRRELDQEKLDKEKEIVELRQRQEEAKADRERRSMQRKDTSEMIRYTPVIITGLVGIVSLVWRWIGTTKSIIAGLLSPLLLAI